MMFPSSRRRLMHTLVITWAVVFASLASAAHGQDRSGAPDALLAQNIAQNTAPQPAARPDSPDQPAQISEVVVTGSRIPQQGLKSTSPLTVVNDQEIKLEGTTDVASLLNNLPQAYADQTSGISNGASGTATVNLRDLGSNRTLVLVDGRRLMPGDPGLPVADLNNIPAQLVDRVEVITGGASAVYGSDAVAGVVNFIMKHDFQGVRVDVQGGFAQHDNGPDSSVDSAIAAFNAGSPAVSNIHYPGSIVTGRNSDATAIFGANTPDDKGNVTAYVEYRNLQPVTQDLYSWSSCALNSGPATPGGSVANLHTCVGAPSSIFGNFLVSPTATSGVLPGAVTTTLANNPNGSRTFVPYTNALAFNYAPFNYIQRPDDRYSAGYFAHYKIDEHVELYSDFMFADDHTVSAIAPSGLFQGAGSNGASTYQLNCNNPLLSASQAQDLCGTAAGTGAITNILAGMQFGNGGLPRMYDSRHTDYKIDIGARGELAQGWKYDAYLQYGTSIFSEVVENDVSTAKVQNALLVDPTTGQCMSGGSCVPLDVFRFGGITQAAYNYLYTPGFEQGETIEEIISASVTGDLGRYNIHSPFAGDGIGVALGSEYRREDLSLRADEVLSSGELSGSGGPLIGNSGAFDVYELFGEVRVPLVQDKPFVKNLSFDGAYRFSQYSSAGRTDTYEAQLEYSPTRDFTLRGGYNRAVRAPDVNELFSAQAIGNYAGTDPCEGTNPAASLAACERTGVTPAQYGHIFQCPSGQCSQLYGGNPNLQPEIADTFTLGGVFTPSFLRGFSLTLDWFDIKVSGLIQSGVGGAGVTVAQCLQTGSPIYCSLIRRDPATGDLFGQSGYVIATNVNTGFLRTEGVDLEGNYRFQPSEHFNMRNIGTFSLNFVGTYTEAYVDQPVSDGGTYDCAGLYGSDKCGLPIPKWRHKARLTWEPPYPFTLSLEWRYIGATDFDGNSSNAFLHENIYNAIDGRLPAYSYFDVTATWRIRDGLTARMGVDNIADKDPPTVDANAYPASSAALGNGNTFPGIYDALGRTFFFGITADF